MGTSRGFRRKKKQPLAKVESKVKSKVESKVESEVESEVETKVESKVESPETTTKRSVWSMGASGAHRPNALWVNVRPRKKKTAFG